MPYPAIVIANEIIKLAKAEGIPVTPMKLQKILYLANGISYKRKNNKLINERFEAWDYGPVVRNVYSIYRDFKGKSITEPIDEFVYTNGFSFALASSFEVDNEDLRIIKEGWDNSKNLDAFTLSAWSHNKNSPWDKAYNAIPKEVYISEDEIRSYFLNFIKE
jgi:uncharacterized phage-associated protein